MFIASALCTNLILVFEGRDIFRNVTTANIKGSLYTFYLVPMFHTNVVELSWRVPTHFNVCSAPNEPTSDDLFFLSFCVSIFVPVNNPTTQLRYRNDVPSASLRLFHYLA